MFRYDFSLSKTRESSDEEQPVLYSIGEGREPQGGVCGVSPIRGTWSLIAFAKPNLHRVDYLIVYSSRLLPANYSTHHQSKSILLILLVAYCLFCVPPRMADEVMEIDGAPSAPTSNHSLFYAHTESFTPQGTSDNNL